VFYLTRAGNRITDEAERASLLQQLREAVDAVAGGGT